jgi:hypothetical protein
LSAFERVGVAYLAGSRRSLKIKIEGKTYYVHVNDIGRALADANFKAYILKLRARYNKFIKQADWYVAYASNILKKQKEEATEIDIFECDINQGVLKVKDWENPISEYQRRISELAKK